MKLVECQLESISPYSQSKHYTVEKLPRENPVDYEKRTWRERCNTNSDGHLIIPPMAFANCIKQAAKYAAIPIPGQGRALYTKNFEAGVMVAEPLVLPETKENVGFEWLFLPSDGRRGGGKRVDKCFPLIPFWSGAVNFYLLDDIITQEVFAQVLDVAGALVGIGRFRPQNTGYYGRFKVNHIEWAEG
jgi:hypothetical protein